jgi:hypothetical protein
MKRMKRMVSMGYVAEHLLAEYRDPTATVLPQGLPERMFGRALASRIQGVRLSGNELCLMVEDPLWRRELEKNKDQLLEKARTIRPKLSGLRVISTDPKTLERLNLSEKCLNSHKNRG